jgi:alkylation response protein AidB-like acyl-CoA dehydrogenase
MMEFRLDDGQVELQQTVVRFFEDHCPMGSIAAREGAEVDRSLWAGMAELGTFGLLLPVDAGGSGLGVIEAALLFEQLGSYLVPGPVLWSVLASGLVEGVVTGDLLVGGIESEWVDERVAAVEHVRSLDALLVFDADRITLHRLGPDSAVTPLHPLDPLTPIGCVHLGEGEVIGGPTEARRAGLVGTTLAAAQLAGIAHRSLEVARAYALEREQFDAPIGSFQAIKHLLADMYVRSTLAQSAVYAAAAVIDEPGADDPARAAAGAKVLAGDAAIANASSAVQILGGMGFTWQMAPNYLLKRAWVLERTFGSADDHAAARGAAVLAEAR